MSTPTATTSLAMTMLLRDVARFHRATGVPNRVSLGFPPRDRQELRHGLINEEVNIELLPTIAYVVQHAPHMSAAELAGAMIEIADAIADSIYVLLGTALEYGIPLEAVWAAVQAANMAKVDPETGLVRRREDGKILKPPGWTPPDIAKALREHSLGWLEGEGLA